MRAFRLFITVLIVSAPIHQASASNEDFHNADTDASRFLTYEEFENGIYNPELYVPDPLQAFFIFDQNFDGHISLEEWNSAWT